MATSVDDFADLKALGIDCDSPHQTADIFLKAADHLRHLLPSLDSAILLTLYGLYKQGSEGPCNTDRPRWYDMRAKSKWEAWNRLGQMAPEEARAAYVALIRKLDPSFDSGNIATAPPPSRNESWAKVSYFEQTEETVADTDKCLSDRIREGDVAMVTNLLRSEAGDIRSGTLNALDEKGLAPIHWASDCGSVEMLTVLIEFGANVDLRDAEGQTALHYASSCGHVECLKLLLERGACRSVLDNDGASPLSVAADDGVRKLLE